MMAARGTDSPQILPMRQQAENSKMDSSGVLVRGEVTEGGIKLEGSDETPFKGSLEVEKIHVDDQVLSQVWT